MVRYVALIFSAVLIFASVSVQADERVQCNSYETCKPLAISGNADAQFYMGYAYHYGKGVDQDPVKAMQWYVKAATQKHMGAQINSGYMCSIDKNAKNKDEIVNTWIKSAVKSPVFQNCLGNLYHDGAGIDIDNAQAVYWYKKAANQGYADAQYNLGHMLYSGLGVEKNISSGMEVLEAASQQGHPKAIESLKRFKK